MKVPEFQLLTAPTPRRDQMQIFCTESVNNCTEQGSPSFACLDVVADLKRPSPEVASYIMTSCGAATSARLHYSVPVASDSTFGCFGAV